METGGKRTGGGGGCSQTNTLQRRGTVDVNIGRPGVKVGGNALGQQMKGKIWVEQKESQNQGAKKGISSSVGEEKGGPRKNGTGPG